MNLRREGKALLVAVLVFCGLYHPPVGSPRFDGSVIEALAIILTARVLGVELGIAQSAFTGTVFGILFP